MAEAQQPAAPAQQTALVVGASGGIGAALVAALCERPDVGRVFAASRSGEAPADARATPLQLDVTDEASLAEAAATVARQGERLHHVFVASGVLHGEGFAPERRLEQVSPEALAHVFAVNATGPLLVAKHVLPLLRHDEGAVLACLSARVGSLGDNRLGGWYAYRASKAALNMFVRSLAIEVARRAPNALCVALHPGTVDTALSQPFQRGVKPEQLFSPQRAARQLLAVTDGLGPGDSGGFFAWDGSPIPW